MGLLSFLLGTEKKETRKIPKNVQESIPFEQIYTNGVIETEPGVFSKAYELEDVNYRNVSLEEQKRMSLALISLLNSLSKDIDIQFLILNTKMEKKNTFSGLRFSPQDDGLNPIRNEMNELIFEKVINARNSLEQKKYMVLSLADHSVAHAMYRFEQLDSQIQNGLYELSSDAGAKPQTAEERLRTLFEIYNQDGEAVFENGVDKNGNGKFTLKALLKQGITVKDLIGPSGIQFRRNHFQIGNTYGRALFLSSVPTWLSTDFLSDVTAVSAPMAVSVIHRPIDQEEGMKKVQDAMRNVQSEISGKQEQAMKDGYGFDLMSPALAQAKKQMEELVEDILSRDQRLFYSIVLISVFGSSMEELEDNTKRILAVVSGYRTPFRTLQYQQEAGFNACLPLCLNKLEIRRMFTTESASVFLPYTAQELRQENGLFYGVNEATNNIIMYSRTSGHNYNGLIFGESGSGKSMFAKTEMLSVMLRSDRSRVYVIDPESEYTGIAKWMNGEVIDLSATAGTYLNPMDMDLDYDGQSEPLSMKTDYIISMIDIMLGQDGSLNPASRSIVGRCIRNIYRGYIEEIEKRRREGENVTFDKDSMPTLLNLYNELLRQDEPEAKTVADIIEIYAKGAMDVFAHRSNVDTGKNFVVYDIKNLGTGLKSVGLYVCLNDIWNKMIENRKKDLWTWIYIDEFYLLLRSDSAASFLTEIWKRARKWNGIPTGIMQNTDDLMKSNDAEDILKNSSFIAMMSMHRNDRMNLSEMLQIPESQLKAITNGKQGHGLLYAGKSLIPFNNEYPRDSEIYKHLSTSGTLDKERRYK